MKLPKQEVIANELEKVKDRTDIVFTPKHKLILTPQIVANIEGILALALSDTDEEALALVANQNLLREKLNLSLEDLAALQMSSMLIMHSFSDLSTLISGLKHLTFGE